MGFSTAYWEAKESKMKGALIATTVKVVQNTVCLLSYINITFLT